MLSFQRIIASEFHQTRHDLMVINFVLVLLELTSDIMQIKVKAPGSDKLRFPQSLTSTVQPTETWNIFMATSYMNLYLPLLR